MAADYPSSLCYSGLVIVTEWIAVHDWCGTRRTMQSCLMTAPNETLVQPLPRMRPIYHYDTTLDCVMPLTKAILCQQFNAFVQFPDSQALTKKAVLESLRMINADQIHHQLRNFNDSRLNRCFDALIVLLEEDVPVLITWPTLSSIRLMLRTRHRFEARMPQYYSTLPFRVRAGLENRHAIRRFAQNERIRIYIRYTCELIQRYVKDASWCSQPNGDVGLC
jgi:hypothetical protein